MNTGFWWVGLALLVLAVFPAFAYSFFSLVVLERKSQGLVEDLKNSRAFENELTKDQVVSEESVKSRMMIRYGYKRFLWPVSMLVFFQLVGFSIVWEIIGYQFSMEGQVSPLLYSTKFLTGAELPMMAFIGVVIFNYGNIIRRLYVWDLTTPVFWNALYRTWLVIAVAAVLRLSGSFLVPQESSTSGHGIGLHAAFFMIGFIVNEILAMMIDRARERFQVKRLKVDELPLSLIQGINFWHEFRLEEEGVENVQNLATCNVIDLAIATRYDLRTLIDWMDQAILVHRMGTKATALRDAGFISGAIDMAWGAPTNVNGDTRLSDQISKTLGCEPIYICTLMNSLYQDTQVQALWNLWQSDLDAPQSDKPTTISQRQN